MTIIDDLSWVLVGLSLIGKALVVNSKLVSGFIISLISSIGWGAYQIHKKEYSTAVLLCIFAIMYAWGAFKTIYLKNNNTIENVNNV